MTIVKYKWWIQLMKYKYKENHLYTYTLIQNTMDTDMLVWHPSITFARGNRSVRSLTEAYFRRKRSPLLHQFQLCDLKHVMAKSDIASADKWTTKEWSKNLALYTIRLRKWRIK